MKVNQFQPYIGDEEYEAILAGDSYACVGVYSLKKKDILMVMANNVVLVLFYLNLLEWILPFLCHYQSSR